MTDLTVILLMALALSCSVALRLGARAADHPDCEIFVHEVSKFGTALSLIIVWVAVAGVFFGGLALLGLPITLGLCAAALGISYFVPVGPELAGLLRFQFLFAAIAVISTIIMLTGTVATYERALQ
ncbi:MAG: hypothetical protein AAFR98_00355 [Pseudomonadota bacterium]